MRFKLEIDCASDVFRRNPDATLSQMLRTAAEHVRRGDASEFRHGIRDAELNEVGFFVLVDEEFQENRRQIGEP